MIFKVMTLVVFIWCQAVERQTRARSSFIAVSKDVLQLINSGVMKNGTDRYVLIIYINPVKESQLLRF